MAFIINKNLKLLLINYLAQKVDVLFHFPSGSQGAWDRTFGRTVYRVTGSTVQEIFSAICSKSQQISNTLSQSNKSSSNF